MKITLKSLTLDGKNPHHRNGIFSLIRVLLFNDLNRGLLIDLASNIFCKVK